MYNRSPFQSDDKLRSIVSGKEAEKEVNVDNAREIGEKIIAENTSKAISEVTFLKANQAVIMSLKSSAVNTGKEIVHVDPQLLFQRMTSVVGDD